MDDFYVLGVLDDALGDAPTSASSALAAVYMQSTIHSLIQVVPTIQLLEGVPRVLQNRPAAAHHPGRNGTSVSIRWHQVEDDWWSPKLYSASLRSLVVRPRRSKRAERSVCVLMADSRHALFDASHTAHLALAHAQGRRREMYRLPAMVNLLTAVDAGYDFAHLQMPASYPGRYPAWLKLVALRAVIEKYDYVLYLDSDTFFRRPGIAGVVEAIVREGGLSDRRVLALTRESPDFPDVANTGILAFRRSPVSLRMLEEWWASVVQYPALHVYRQRWSFEQAAFTHVLYPRYNESIALLDFVKYNSPDGVHIRHIYSLLSTEEREAIFVAAGASLLRQEGAAEDAALVDEVAACQRLIELVNSALVSKADVPV